MAREGVLFTCSTGLVPYIHFSTDLIEEEQQDEKNRSH